MQQRGIGILDRYTYPVIQARRNVPDLDQRTAERWLDRKQLDDPGRGRTSEAGCRAGRRRCLGAALVMAEQRVVLEAMILRLDLEAAHPAPEPALHRNVTMIPARGPGS